MNFIISALLYRAMFIWLLAGSSATFLIFSAVLAIKLKKENSREILRDAFYSSFRIVIPQLIACVVILQFSRGSFTLYGIALCFIAFHAIPIYLGQKEIYKLVGRKNNLWGIRLAGLPISIIPFIFLYPSIAIISATARLVNPEAYEKERSEQIDSDHMFSSEPKEIQLRPGNTIVRIPYNHIRYIHSNRISSGWGDSEEELSVVGRMKDRVEVILSYPDLKPKDNPADIQLKGLDHERNVVRIMISYPRPDNLSVIDKWNRMRPEHGVYPKYIGSLESLDLYKFKNKDMPNTWYLNDHILINCEIGEPGSDIDLPCHVSYRIEKLAIVTYSFSYAHLDSWGKIDKSVREKITSYGLPSPILNAYKVDNEPNPSFSTDNKQERTPSLFSTLTPAGQIEY